MNDKEYKGYYITTGDNTFTVQCDGEDCNFDTEEDAKEFIDGMTEDHFDDKEDGVEPEDPEYDEDEVLNEDHLGESYYRVWYTDFDTGEDVMQDIWGRDNAEVRRMINPQGRIKKIQVLKAEAAKPKTEGSDDTLYTTTDLADAIVDLLKNFDSMDWDTGAYDLRDEALENLVNMPIFDEMPEDDVTAVIEDLDYDVLSDFVIAHPDQAESMFKTVASVFGYKNYRDYKSYVDYIKSDEYDQYLKDIYDDFNDTDVASRLGKPIFTDEAINTGAIVNTPGKHILIDLDEDDDLPDDIDLY